MIYRISHITDLMQIPVEHWDECVNDILGCIISLRMLEGVAKDTPGAKFDIKEICPHIDFTPDGLGNITSIVNGKKIFTMKLTRGESQKGAKHD